MTPRATAGRLDLDRLKALADGLPDPADRTLLETAVQALRQLSRLGVQAVPLGECCGLCGNVNRRTMVERAVLSGAIRSGDRWSLSWPHPEPVPTVVPVPTKQLERLLAEANRKAPK